MGIVDDNLKALYDEFIFKIDRDIEKNKRYNRKFYRNIT
jgi:hypothetical protein